MVNSKFILTFFFVLMISVSGYAQPTVQKTSLTKILLHLEKKFECKFSYADKVVEKLTIEPLADRLSLSRSLAEIEQQTNLHFIKINKHLYALQIREKSNDKFSEEIEKLEEIMLTDYLSKGISKRSNGALRINYKNFGILPGLIEPDVLQTLEALPGVESVNEKISNLNVRGGTNDQNLILWDGIRMYQSGHFFGLISAFNPYQTKTASLIKNGTSPAFGNSVSSVIDMRTEKKVNSKFHGEAGVNYIAAHAFTDVPIDDESSIQFAARSSISGVFKTPTYNQYYDRAFQDTEIASPTSNIIKADDKFSFYDLSLRYLKNFKNNDRLRANFIYISNDLAFNKNAIINDSIQSRKSTLSQNSLGAGIFYEKQFSKTFNASAQYYLSKYKLAAKNVDIFKDFETREQNEVLENSLKLSTFWEFNPNFTWQNGYEYLFTKVKNPQEGEVNPILQNHEENSLHSQALFSSLHYKSPSNKTFFNFGGRLNYFEKFNLFLAEPRFTFNQRLLDFFTLEVLGEFKSQTTSQIIDYQNNFLDIEKRQWLLADQNEIPIVKSKQLSVGLNYTHNKWLISTEAYAKKVSGITSQSQGFQNQFQYAKIIGDYFVRGLDFLISKKIKHFGAWFSYSLTDNTYDFPAMADSNLPNNIEIVNSLSFAASYSIKNSKISLGANWRNGKPFTEVSTYGINNNILDFEHANSNNLPDYIRVDFSASQKFQLHDKLWAYAGVSLWNLLNQQNIINTYYEDRNGEVTRIEQHALGITPNFVFRLLF